MNSKGHLLISIAKSIIRIGSCTASLVFGMFSILVAGFLVAELLGVVEEIVDKR